VPKAKQPNKFWKMQASGENSADVFIFGEITTSGWELDESDTSASTFKRDLDALGDVSTINLHINSPGGDVFDGIAIGNMIKQHKAQVNCYIDGVAASIASVIAMSGDTIFMPSNAMMMVHNPWSFAYGNAADFRKQADDLDHIADSLKQVYLEKSGDKLDLETITQLMDAETWLSAQEAFDYGLCDKILSANQAAASISQEWAGRYKNVPKALIDPSTEPEKRSESNLLAKKLKALKGE